MSIHFFSGSPFLPSPNHGKANAHCEEKIVTETRFGTNEIARRDDHRDVAEISFDSIADFRLQTGKTVLSVKGEPLPYYLFTDIKEHGRPLIVFGQGMAHRDQYTLPRFQRMDWSSSFEENILIINDPTLFQDERLKLGWCLGNSEYYVLPRLTEIVSMAAEQLGISQRSVMFYGSSAGGFTSLMMSSRLPGSIAFVNNPQTDVLQFKRGGVSLLLDVAFGGISIDEAYEKFGDRFSFVRWLQSESAVVPRLYYWQNILDEDHYQDQMLPLMAGLQERMKRDGSQNLSCSIIFDLYSCPATLHNPLGLNSMRERIATPRQWQHKLQTGTEKT
jgi:hypothetical protein